MYGHDRTGSVNAKYFKDFDYLRNIIKKIVIHLIKQCICIHTYLEPNFSSDAIRFKIAEFELFYNKRFCL